VISVTIRRRRCSHCGLRYLSPWQRSEAVDVARPPRRVARISSCHGTEMGVCAEASLDQRARRLCLCNLIVTVPWWRRSRGRWSLQQVAPRRGTTLVMTTQESAICFGLLSHVVEDGDVLCRVCLFVFRGLFVWWMFRPVMYQCCFFLHDIVVIVGQKARGPWAGP
jgi:hypothetical protein